MGVGGLLGRRKKMGELSKRVGWAKQLLEMVISFNNFWGGL